MRAREEVISELVQQWIDKAEKDFGLAEFLLAEARYLDAVGFHAQQAAEKYIKAFLTEHQIEFPKTHRIEELLALVAQTDPKLADSLLPATQLNPYGADIRYPGDIPELTLETAAQALNHAADVRAAIHHALGLERPH